MDFHLLIARAPAIPLLASAIERSRVLVFNWLFSRTPAFRPFPERWHRDLAKVLAEGTPLEAAEAMRAHVRFRLDEVVANAGEAADGPVRMLRGPQRVR